MPGVLVTGVIAPVDGSMVNPVVEEKSPPAVPVSVTWMTASEEQIGGYAIAAVGDPVTVTEAVAMRLEHPPVPGRVYLII